MNNLLRDLIVEKKVAIEAEKGHDEIVEEVLRRLEENDLFVKPEKCI